MKKITLLIALFVFAFGANATIYLDETFNYSAPSLLKNASGWLASGTMGSWPEDYTIGSSALTYSNAGGSYIHSGVGNQMVTAYIGNYTPTATSNYYVAKNFNASAISTGTVYVSFLYFPNNISQSQSQSPIISLGTVASSNGVQVHVGKGIVNAANFRFGTTRGSTTGGDVKWATPEYSSISSVYFIVLKYDFVTGVTSQIASVFVNPVIGSSSQPTADVIDNTSTSSLKTTLQTVQFKVNGSNKQSNVVSGIRVCSTWAEAVAAKSLAPPLSKPTVGTASLISTSGFTANWTPVTDAVGYDVSVYLGANLISTKNVGGQAISSLAITGLMSGLTYKYTVIAKGDVANHADSDPSDASTSFTTLGLPAPVLGTPSDITSSSFTANWTPVANASSYDVKLYLTTNLLITNNVSGQGSASLAFTGLAMGTTYTYTVTAIGDGVTYLNSDASTNSSIAKTLATTVSVINPTFSDGTWGAVYTVSLTLGAYPTFSANGFDLTKGCIQTNTAPGPKGEIHTHMLKLDKSSNSGVLYLPTVASVEEIEIHSSATAGRQYTLEVSTNGGLTYTPVGTYTNSNANLEQIDIINTGSLTNAKFRITNISTGAYSFYQITTRLTHPATLITPTVGVGNSIDVTSFTANWIPVSNATGYEVKVYTAYELKKTVSVSVQSTSSASITGLQGDSVYTYKVKAMGDDSYLDSYQSAASATVTTLHDTSTGATNSTITNSLIVVGNSIVSLQPGFIEIYNLQGVRLLSTSIVDKLNTRLNTGLYVIRFTNRIGVSKTQKLQLK